MIREITVDGGEVEVTVALTTMACPLRGSISDDVRQAVATLPDVSNVRVRLAELSAEEKNRLRQTLQAGARGASGANDEEEYSRASELNRIDKVIAIMSGKGGVGKSLVCGLLAVSLARAGKKVGILDADVTGPSIPRMFGLREHPGSTPFGILPVRSELGIEVMSINLILNNEDDAVIWRGPMITSAIKQFWHDVVWGELDYLLVDMPPGTSDVPLTVMQSLPVSGVVIVSSPQQLVGMVVRKAVQMAKQLSKPIVGVVENMSYFECSDSGKRYEVFGPSHADQLAAVTGAPLLASLPVDPAIATLADEGRIEQYSSPAYEELARAFAALP